MQKALLYLSFIIAIVLIGSAKQSSNDKLHVDTSTCKSVSITNNIDAEIPAINISLRKFSVESNIIKLIPVKFIDNTIILRNDLITNNIRQIQTFQENIKPQIFIPFYTYHFSSNLGKDDYHLA